MYYINAVQCILCLPAVKSILFYFFPPECVSQCLWQEAVRVRVCVYTSCNGQVISCPWVMLAGWVGAMLRSLLEITCCEMSRHDTKMNIWGVCCLFTSQLFNVFRNSEGISLMRGLYVGAGIVLRLSPKRSRRWRGSDEQSDVWSDVTSGRKVTSGGSVIDSSFHLPPPLQHAIYGPRHWVLLPRMCRCAC